MRDKIDGLKEAEPGKAYKILKNLGAQPGDCDDSQTFSLPGHLTENLSDQQSAERIADHFASISSEYNPLDLDLVPDRVRQKLSTESTPPKISEYECYEKIMKAKKPQSGVPGDLPAKIVKEHSVELAGPLHTLLNKIVQTAEWPKQWKMEYITPIGKVPLPETEDDLRPISLTAFNSKVMEQFVVMWLLEVIGEKLDFRQYGGMKGNSISHYLIELVNFILHSQDRPEATAVLLCLVDFSKAFNRQDHNILITKLSDLGVPGWLLKLVIAFLKHREMVVRYKGKVSSPRGLPGGGPQGTLLGLLLFIVLINDVGFKGQCNQTGELITSKQQFKQVNEIHLKYVDDLSLAEAITMKEQLTVMPVEHRPQPDNLHARTGHAFRPEDSKVFKELERTKQYAADNGMQINARKTKLMLFNPARSMDFMPAFPFKDSEIEVVDKTKLLGLIIRTDMSWVDNTEYIVTRCNKKLWILRRLKKLGASQEDLLDIYYKQVRSIVEFAVPVWHSSITQEERMDIERIQKTACNIILGDHYQSYTSALKMLCLDTLFNRRTKLCKNFARKSAISRKFSNWFKVNKKISITRNKQDKYCKVYSRTVRFDKSPLSYLTSILNSIKW